MAKRADYETILAAALAASQFGAALQATRALEVLDATTARTRAVARIARLRDPAARLRAHGRLAASEGGWTAAEKFEAQALAIERQRQAAAKAAAEAELGDLDLDALVEQLLGMVPDLPRDAALQLYRALVDRGDLHDDDG